MMTAAATFELLSTLLAYPQADFLSALAVCDAGDADADAAVAGRLKQFAASLPSREPNDLEELYVQTFDMNPDRALEIGWHLFGETYERGSFLVQARGLLREYGVEESSELPDHLAHLLKLIGRMPEPAAGEFARKFLLPGIAKLRAAFADAQQPYHHCLVALEQALQAAFAGQQGV